MGDGMGELAGEFARLSAEAEATVGTLSAEQEGSTRKARDLVVGFLEQLVHAHETAKETGAKAGAKTAVKGTAAFDFGKMAAMFGPMALEKIKAMLPMVKQMVRRANRERQRISPRTLLCVRLISLLRFSPLLTFSFLPFPSSFSSLLVPSHPFSPLLAPSRSFSYPSTYPFLFLKGAQVSLHAPRQATRRSSR